MSVSDLILPFFIGGFQNSYSLIFIFIYYYYFNPHPRRCLLILDREGGREGERERDQCEGETPGCALTGG